MIISYWENKKVSAEISDLEVIKITLAKLYQLVAPGTFLKYKWDAVEGYSTVLWLACDESNWRHGSISTEYIHPATEFEKAVFLVIENLNGTNKNKN